MEKILTTMIDQLKASGYKVTAPRRAILQLLIDSRDHLSAPEVHGKLKPQFAHLGLATVYRTLELFQAIGAVKCIHFPVGALRYEINWPHDHHHHLICTQCGQVLEVGLCPLQGWEGELETITRFQIQWHMMELMGLCPRCQEK